MNTIKVSEVVYREDLYPRFKPNPSKIQEYAENLELLPPIEVSQHHILIDGYHRWKAYQTAGVDEIPCVITEVKSEQELLMLAVRRNAAHGQQLTQEEKKRYAIRWWDVLPDDEIIETLSISRNTFLRWTRDKRREKEAEQKQRVYDLWMRCETQERIAEQVGVPRQTVADWIANFAEIDPEADSGIFRDFEPELYTGQTPRARAARIAEQVGVPQRTVADWIASFSENGSEDDSAIFRDFEPELYTGQTPRARAALVSSGNVSLTHEAANPTCASCNKNASGNISPSDMQTPRARELHQQGVEMFPHPDAKANPMSARATVYRIRWQLP